MITVMQPRETSMGGPQGGFKSTQWSVVLKAGAADREGWKEALQSLLQDCWRPIYVCIRYGWKKSVDEAQDLTQDFLVYVMEKGILRKVDPTLGRFRTYLKAVLRNFMSATERDAHRLKRGGGASPFHIDDAAVGPLKPSDMTVSPEDLFEKEWGRGILERCMRELKLRLTEAGKGVYFEIFREHDLQPRNDSVPSYEALATKYGLKPSNVRNYLHVVRKSYRSLLRELVGTTLRESEDVEDEIRQIFKSL